MHSDEKTILFTSSGTGGPTVPLIAVYEYIKNIDTQKTRCGSGFSFRWIGTKSGLEREIISQYGIPFVAFPATKLRRYFSWKTFVSPFVFVYALVKSFVYLIFNRPDIIVSAGSFVSVPIVVAGWMLRIPSLIHQQDIQPTLSNMLMKPFAKTITVSFEEQKKYFGNNAVVTGNPTRKEIKSQTSGDREKALNRFGLSAELPILLIMGGGSGARQISDLLDGEIKHLLDVCQIIHITGKLNKDEKIKHTGERYKRFDFLTDDMHLAIKVADVVVTRAGMSSLSELSVLGKPAIIIPMPDSHQEHNAKYFQMKKSAIVLNYDRDITNDDKLEFVDTVRGLLSDKEKQHSLSSNIVAIMPPDSSGRVADEILRIIC